LALANSLLPRILPAPPLLQPCDNPTHISDYNLESPDGLDNVDMEIEQQAGTWSEPATSQLSPLPPPPLSTNSGWDLNPHAVLGSSPGLSDLTLLLEPPVRHAGPDPASLTMALLQPQLQPTNRFSFQDNSDDDRAECPNSEPADKESFEDAQAGQLSLARSERTSSRPASPTSASMWIVPHLNSQFQLPNSHSSPAFRTFAAPRKTGADYDNEKVIRHLNMLTAERARPGSSGPLDPTSAQIDATTRLTQRQIPDSVRGAKALARARSNADFSPVEASPPLGFDSWGHQVQNISQRLNSGGAAQNPRPHSSS
jgi:hypothetical protein